MSTLAHREDLTIGPGGSLSKRDYFRERTGPYLLQGQKHFWSGDQDRAAAELQAAIKADSACGLAYLRLSLVQAWQFDYGGAVGSLDAGLRQRERMAPRWVNLLEAQRQLMLGSGHEAIDGFQNAVLDHRNDIDAWFGLGESLFHYGGWNGQSPQDSRPASSAWPSWTARSPRSTTTWWTSRFWRVTRPAPLSTSTGCPRTRRRRCAGSRSS